MKNLTIILISFLLFTFYGCSKKREAMIDMSPFSQMEVNFGKELKTENQKIFFLVFTKGQREHAIDLIRTKEEFKNISSAQTEMTADKAVERVIKAYSLDKKKCPCKRK